MLTAIVVSSNTIIKLSVFKMKYYTMSIDFTEC